MKKRTSQKRRTETFKLGELFCGPGGIGWAAKQAKAYSKSSKTMFKIKHTWANDIHEDTCKTFARNILGDEKGVEVGRKSSDIGKKSVLCMPVQQLVKYVHQLPNIDALTFGFPCNDFSLVGEHRGIDGDFGPLYRYAVEILKAKKPKWFIAENVTGIRSANSGNSYKTILDHLENPPYESPKERKIPDSKRVSYKLIPHLYKFEDYRVPQRRHRIIIVGIRSDLPFSESYRPPIPTTQHPDWVAGRTKKGAPLFVSAEEALRLVEVGDAFHEERFLTGNSRIRIDNTPAGHNAWSETLHKKLKEKNLTHAALNVKRVRLSNIYKRLEKDKPSYTVTGSGGGGTYMYHWKEPRPLSNRERALLQSFPANYHFVGNKGSVRRQVGMAVPPLAVETILNSILKYFAGISYKSVDPFDGTKD